MSEKDSSLKTQAKGAFEASKPVADEVHKVSPEECARITAEIRGEKRRQNHGADSLRIDSSH